MMRDLSLRPLIILFLLLSIPLASIRSQESLNSVQRPYQVFLSPRETSDGRDTLIFIDLLTGDEQRLSLTGSQYTLTDSSVMFFDRLSGRVQTASPTGILREHPFVQMPPGARRIDWQIGDEQIVWTITTGIDSALTTETWVANLDGTGQHLVFSDGPRSGIRAYPVAFSIGMDRLYMDYQPDTIGDITPLRQYAGLFSVDIATGQAQSLPGEPGCFCGAGFGAGWFLRLALTPNGFDMHAFHLAVNALESRMTALNYPDFTQGGGILVNPDGTQAVYVLARLGGLTTANTENSGDSTTIVGVDLIRAIQYAAAPPLEGLFRPISWYEEHSILITDRLASATWKFDLENGSLTQIASGVVLGTLGYNSQHG